jgi:hypothetical protein
MHSEDMIAEKYDELLRRVKEIHSIQGFTTAERAVWFLVSIRCEIDINSFEDVFIQLLPLSEITEAIGYMDELGLNQVAELFQRAVDILEAHHFDYRTTGYHGLPKQVISDIQEIGNEVQEKNYLLWEIDAKLCDMLNCS